MVLSEKKYIYNNYRLLRYQGIFKKEKLFLFKIFKGSLELNSEYT